jgi:hypothetical protein
LEKGTTLYGIRVPTVQTLKRYGLHFEDWLDIVEQNVFDIDGEERWFCPVCGKTPPSGRTVVDHFHVKGWKKMEPHDRKKCVRGVVCVTCNHFVLTRYGTPEKFRRAASYLERHERRAA